ncbi:MAG: hypothetical protein ACFFCI_01245 [Promethearchaeota archaeon]
MANRKILQTSPNRKPREYLPIGTILMYNGIGIANVGNRLTQIGDEPGDTITMSGWYVCNGNASTPNLIDKFIRGETASGNTGGNDSLTLEKENLPTHNHSASCDNNTHSHNCNDAGLHSHRLSGNPGIIIGGYWNAGLANDPNRGAWKDDKMIIEEAGSHNHSLVTDTHNHNITIGSSGGGDAIAIKPAYYSLIFIIKLKHYQI